LQENKSHNIGLFGRGTEPLETWESHGSSIKKGAGQTWLVLFGIGADTLGEVKTNE
tara:strand:+ start:59101 stop:59268 length:168 start_codon:yes stop_codon:yes gene_type:complete